MSAGEVGEVKLKGTIKSKNGAQTKHIGMKRIGMKPIATKPIGLKGIGYKTYRNYRYRLYKTYRWIKCIIY